ncbi:hypothetical protein GTZ99_03820 [Novosphingobium sp. FSY-8]|uniref:Sensory transduction regulator n=1 Tax=Novosphingobium ovatum TaxID=1908523 RepID=A0ABW9XAX7_9SPHN|nr:hypothetical protein [Novosphingobium ovatum]NBC35680.1 hypothetical protein [Novosphingobium ovatum]
MASVMAAPARVMAAPVAAPGVAVVDASTPEAFATVLKEMGYEVGPVEQVVPGVSARFLVKLGQLPVQAVVSGCTNGQGCHLVSMLGGVGKLNVTDAWLAKTNKTNGLGKVLVNDAGIVLVTYPMFPQGMQRDALRLALDNFAQSFGVTVRAAIDAGLISVAPAPAGGAPAPAPAPARKP